MNATSSTVESSVAHLTALLADLEPAAPPSHSAYESRLVEVRLGLASGLFTALRYKHAPTAAHSLRVALGCSSWAFSLGLESEVREALEVAALLHDIGKIGAPDSLLLKPGPLAGNEAKVMDNFRLSGLDILATCCPSRSVVEVIRHSGGWYDGTRGNYHLTGETIPFGARLLAIVDAFDSMTTDQVYRRAMSRERAMHELFTYAGTQFDPALVQSFSELEITVPLHRKVVGHWLENLDPQRSNRFWNTQVPAVQPPAAATGNNEALFQQKLLDNMHDAVVFIDRGMLITLWNRGAERLTGIDASGVMHHAWNPGLIGMRDGARVASKDFECPVANCLAGGVQSVRRLIVNNRNGLPSSVDVHTVPVVGPEGSVYGAAMILHDASGEASLEERCHNLHERATKDPLTQVANRAEFDRTLKSFVTAHVNQRTPCSLIMCDIDHFKSVNDTFGHQAGDDVLKFFGQLLKGECRTGDLVARYGGEEFAILCAGCNTATAAHRAEQLRRTLNDARQGAAGGKPVTCSFGVTEIQPGDTPGSLLRRADRALMEAKRLGRNLVVQLGSGWDESHLDRSAATPAKAKGALQFDRQLATAVPLPVAIEKIKGFVLDHDAEIVSINGDKIELHMNGGHRKPQRRTSDRPLPFVIMLSLSEQRIPSATTSGRTTGQVLRTHVAVSIQLKRARDRRSGDVGQQAQAVIAAIKSYLMATEEAIVATEGTTRPAANMLSPWFKWRK